jgi:hypothetical protein
MAFYKNLIVGDAIIEKPLYCNKFIKYVNRKSTAYTFMGYELNIQVSG